MLSRYNLALCFSLLVIGGISSAFGVVDETEIELTVLSSDLCDEVGVDKVLYFDADQDGIVDNIYCQGINGGTVVTLTKMLGSGVDGPLVLNLPAGTQKTNSDSIIGDTIYKTTLTVSGNDCTFLYSSINITTGTVTVSDITRTVSASSTASTSISDGRVYNYPTGIGSGAICYSSTTENRQFDAHDGTTTLYSGSDTSLQTTFTFYYPWGFGIHRTAGGDYTQVYGVGDTEYTSAENYGIINYNWRSGTNIDQNEVNVFYVQPDGDLDWFATGVATTPNSNFYLMDPAIRTFIHGFEVPTGYTLEDHATNHYPTGLNKWSDLMNISDWGTLEHIIDLPNYILFDTNTSNRIKLIGEFDGDTYVIMLGSTYNFDYVQIDDLLAQSERGYKKIINEDGVTPLWTTRNITDNMPPQEAPEIKTPSTTINLANSYSFSLPSGYKLNPSISVDRGFKVTTIDDPSSVLYYADPKTSLATLSILVNNSPTQSAISIRDTVSVNGNEAVWAEGFLTGDNGYNLDLALGECVKVYLRDLTLLTSWEYLGELCNSGVMPKSIPYLSNLAFTFWSLEWGVDSKYNQDTSTFETLIRNDSPYTYYIDIYDSTDTLIDSQFYNVTGGGVDLQTYNTTGYSLPARAVYLDASNSTLYQTTIGFPGYLSAVSAQWASIFTVEGFNMLYLIPIVFAAMFTRNSVAIGTGLTVVFIAALVWFGVLVVPEPIIYLMVFIAVIGMIAYKLR